MLVVHIGYHKTGTTWLRHRFFARDELKFHVFSRYSHDMAALLHPHALDFNPEACRRRYAPAIDQCQAEGKVGVITHERLSGDPHSGGYDSKEMADRLHRTFPEARILVGIREQRSMILSCYKQYIKYGGACSLADYLRFKGDHRRPQFSMAHFKYHRLIGHYHRLFGRDSVLVQPYERFRADPAGYMGAIAGFCGVEVPSGLPYGDFVNTSMRPVALTVKRLVNPFIRRDSLNGSSPYVISWLGKPSGHLLQFLDRFSPKALNARTEMAWKAHIESVTAGYYEESNRRTSELIGIDLGIHGYRM